MSARGCMIAMIDVGMRTRRGAVDASDSRRVTGCKIATADSQQGGLLAGGARFPCLLVFGNFFFICVLIPRYLAVQTGASQESCFSIFLQTQLKVFVGRYQERGNAKVHSIARNSSTPHPIDKMSTLNNQFCMHTSPLQTNAALKAQSNLKSHNHDHTSLPIIPKSHSSQA